MNTPIKFLWTAFLTVSVLPNIVLAAGTHVYETEMTYAQLAAFDSAQLGAGRKIVDIEMRWDGSQILYSGVWGEVPGASVHGIVGVGATDWQDFVNDMDALNGRWLDVEVGYFGGQKRWSGIFVDNGDNYSADVRTTLTEAQLETELADNLWNRRQIIDFEAYIENNTTKFAAVWVNDPNQPRTALYYHLTFAQVDDLINPQMPIDPASGLSPLGNTAGRVIDFERYWSTTHGDYRYALILSNHEANGQWLRAATLNELDADNDNYSDGDTQLVDLDVYESGGQMRYLGVWSSDVKSLNEVAAIPSDPDPQPIPANLQTWINNYEADPLGGRVGIYAKNVRTNQSIAYNADRPFYLASTSKIPMHILLWQMDEELEVDIANDTMNYSTSVFNGNPWYVDDRDPNGSLGPNDYGQSFTLAQLDSFMLVQSDNSATSMLLDTQIGRNQMNDWMASLDGIGRGFGPITAITDLDRLIMWQGQVNNFPNDPSYWFIPSWVWERLFRNGADDFGWLQNYVGGGNPLPNYSSTTGHRRYFNMGLNYAEPRAFGLLQESLAEGDFFLTDQRTTDCINVQGASTQLDDAIDNVVFIPGMQPAPAGEQPGTQAKNGGKGLSSDGTRVVNDTAFFTKGPDTIVMVVFTQGNSDTSANIRNNYFPQFGYPLYANLISDLTDAGSEFHEISNDFVQHNQTWWIHSRIENVRPGDATPYKVRYYASENPIIDPNTDYLLGEYQTPTNHSGSAVAQVGITLNDFPVIPPGSYYVGWLIDADNEVGEWNDSTGDNTVLLKNSDGGLQQIHVTPPQLGVNSNTDTSIDMLDVAAFMACFSGADIPVTTQCQWANFDGDARNDADLDDFRMLEGCFTGPGVLMDPDCVEPR